MSPFAVQLLRRVALLSGVAAVLLLGVPRVLTWAGLIGPTPEEDIEAAGRTLAAARSFGAGEDDASLSAGSRQLARARQLLAGGRAREARRAAARARALGIEAQRSALGTREASRRHAQRVVREMDARLNEMEDLHDERARTLDAAEQSRLLSLMKEARQAGGGIFLAFDQGQFARVAEQEPACRETLQKIKEQLAAARGSRSPKAVDRK